MQRTLARASRELGLDMYSFSVFHVFFEQYLTIGGAAARLLLAAGAAVTVTVGVFTGSAWAAAVVAGVLASLLVDLLAVMVLWNIQLNAVRMRAQCYVCAHAVPCLTTVNVLCAAVTLLLGVFFKVRLGDRGRWGWLGVAVGRPARHAGALGHCAQGSAPCMRARFMVE